MFAAILFTTANIWKQSKCPSTGKWVNKMMHTHTHTHNGILRHKKEHIFSICGNMNGHGRHYAK